MRKTNTKITAGHAVIILVALAAILSSCGPKCKQCHTEMMGIKTPATELCGDQLKQAEKTQGMICE